MTAAQPLSLSEFLSGLPAGLLAEGQISADFDPKVGALAIRTNGLTYAITAEGARAVPDDANDPDLFGTCLRCGSGYGDCGVGYCEHDEEAR